MEGTRTPDHRVKGFVRRFLSALLAVAMVLSLTSAGMPGSAVYAEEADAGLCAHHPAHTADCGYRELAECTHVHGPECEKTVTRCVYVHTAEGEPGTEGTGENPEDKKSSVTSPNAEKTVGGGYAHICSEESGCVKTVLDCQHVHTANGAEYDDENGADHDGWCGYIPASPCTYVCGVCPVEALISGLPDHVTADNAAQVKKQLEDILALYQELTEEEQEQLALSRCLELQEELDVLEGQEGAHRPALLEGDVTYRTCDKDGQNWKMETCTVYTAVEAGTTTWNSGWYVVSGTVEMSGMVAVKGDVHLILMDGCQLNAPNSIRLTEGNSLTVYAQSEGDSAGALTANPGGEHNAGIGTTRSGTSGTLIINGGSIKAYGGNNNQWGGAGIGGGSHGNGGTVIINAGIVNATGGGGGAGIGGGGNTYNDTSSAGTIIINGGTVTATGGSNNSSGAGIGTGGKGSGGTITINGGTVTATGGSGYYSGAGIGGGGQASGGTMTINGGTVTATGGNGKKGGNGIGNGASGSNASVTVNDGNVTANGKGGAASITDNKVLAGGTINGITYYTVTFQADQGSVEIPAQSVASGGTITEPAPVEGYVWSGWYTDATYQTPFDFNTGVTKHMTLYAKATQNTDYIASVTIGDETKQYTTFPAAWDSLKNRTGTIRLLKNVTLDSVLVIERGTDVTVDMAEGVTFTNAKTDCFQVKGGTLTLTGGTVVEKQDKCSIVYAESGTLRVTGGSYQSTGNGLWVKDATVRLSGGTIQASNIVLCYEKGGSVWNMLEHPQSGEKLAFYKDGSPVTCDDKNQLPGGSYTVQLCGHNLEWRQNGNDEHYAFCLACKTEQNRGSHRFENGVCAQCGAEQTASVEIDDATTYYISFDEANKALKGQTGTLTLLRDITITDSFTVESGMNVTVKMAEGVTLTGQNDCFVVQSGGTLTLAGGTVAEENANKSVVYAPGGTLYVTGGTYTSKGSGLWADGAAVVQLSGGTIQADKNPLRYGGKSVKDMLDKTQEDRCFAFYKNDALIMDGLTGETLSSGTYTVKAGTHQWGWKQDNNDHYKICSACGREDKNTSESHALGADGICTVCGAAPAASVETEDGTVSKYLSLKDAWDAAQGQTAVLTILRNQSLDYNMRMTDASTDLTVEAAQGVTVNSNTDFFIIKAGNLTLNSGTYISSGRDKSGIFMENGTVEIKGGTIRMTEEYRRSETKGIHIRGGKLIISGGTLQVASRKGYALRVDQGTVMITGGRLIGDYNTVYVTSGQSPYDLLGTGCAYYKNNSPVIRDSSDTLSSGTYTVKLCGHTGTNIWSYTSDASVSGHQKCCRACNYLSDAEPCSYQWSEGETSAACACGSVLTVALSGTDGLVYNGSPQQPEVTVTLQVKDQEARILSAGVDYTLVCTNNINAGQDTATATVTGTTWNGTCTLPFTIRQAVPDLGTVTAEIPENTLKAGDVRLHRTITVPAGTLELSDTSAELTYGSNICTWKFTPAGDDAGNYQTVTGKVEVVAKDTLAPTAQYQAGTDGWKAFVNTISFGLFCKDYKTVTIRTTDDTETVQGSGVAQTLYYISAQEVPDPAAIASWTSYTAPVSLDGQGIYFIYVKVTDHAGNTAILNSEGIVIYAESTVNTTTFSYTYGQNQDCVVSVSTNGNTFLKLTDENGTAIAPADYETDAGGTVTLKAAYLETLAPGTHTYKICMKPQGVETDLVTLAYPFTVTLTMNELTVTEAEAEDRDYDGTDTVEITDVTLDGIMAGDDVAVDLTGLRGVVSSANAGTYHSVTLPELILSGKDKGKYRLIQPGEAVAAEVTIRPLNGEITVGTASYNKTFGDGTFSLSDVAANHQEAALQFAVTKGEDVVSVSDRSVTILNTGTAEITVSLPGTANYLAAAEKVITVHVAKRSGYTVPVINRNYLNTAVNPDSIDLAAILPADCKTAVYGTPVTTGNVTYDTEPAVQDGQLSYTLNSGNAGDEGTITVVVETQNYADITITVHVALTDHISVSLKPGTEVTLKNDTLIYGDVLSKLIFNEAEFVGADGRPVSGTLSWKDGASVPAAGTAGAVWVFTPDDPLYAGTEGMTAITVNRAVPAVSVMPAVEDRLYHPAMVLENDDLTGGVTDVPGVWSWENPAVVPSVENGGYAAVFTPDDTVNYESVTKMIPVTVTKATPYMADLPQAGEITYGDMLELSVLSGGTVRYGDGNGQAGNESGGMEPVAGAFVWKTPSVKPAVADSGKTGYAVVFMPADETNYHCPETTVTVTVRKAPNAPDMPGSMMRVANSCKTVKDVPLPANWKWQETDRETALETETKVAAVAVYTGADKGNYETETVTVTLIRSACDHKAGEILYTGDGEKAPSCTEDGLGHRTCTICGVVIETEIVVQATGHAYTEKVTMEPTTEKEGVRTYTCSRCGHSYTEPIEKLPETSEPEIPETKAPETSEPGTTETKAPEASEPGTNRPETPETKQPGTNRPETPETRQPDTDRTAGGQPENSSTRPEETATRKPFIKGENGKEGWDIIREETGKTKAGGTVSVDMNGTTVVPGDVINDIRGRDITLIFDMGNEIAWRINGQSMTAERVGDTDFSVGTGTDFIPAELVNRVTGERYGIQLRLAHNGAFGFTAVLCIHVGKSNAGFTASLYYYNRTSRIMELVSRSEITADGMAELRFTHASDYIIVIEDTADGKNPSGAPGSAAGNGGESPQTGQPWRPWWIMMLGALVIMLGNGMYLIVDRRKKEENE